MKNEINRRDFFKRSLAVGVGFSLFSFDEAFAGVRKSGMKLGLVTYQWAKDWDLPTLIANCEKAGFGAVSGCEYRLRFLFPSW